MTAEKNAIALEDDFEEDEEIINDDENTKEAEKEFDTHIKLDYTLQSPEERNKLVTKIINTAPP